ncbi:MAG: DUF433 domain-containing protein [Paracoccaceae bacterium]|nr:DUF433 domain-containing protein [Paracoccaceae bacterium]MDE2675975.1 DUF433 domain-containing protein [Paracoccaceae bacterium]
MDKSSLTIREVAHLTGIPFKEVVEQTSIFSTKPSSQKPNGKMLLPKESVLYFFAIDSVDGEKISFKTKTALWKAIRQLKEPVDELEVMGKRFFLNPKARDEWEKTVDYIRKRSEYLEKKPEILGGTTVIKGTRITAYSVRGRLQGKETINHLLEDYPYVKQEAFEIADLYAKFNPPYGRPKELPI